MGLLWPGSLILFLIIPLVALAIDRLLYWIQRELFPYQYGSAGILNKLVRAIMHGWEGFKGLFFKPRDYLDVVTRVKPAVLPARLHCSWLPP